MGGPAGPGPSHRSQGLSWMGQWNHCHCRLLPWWHLEFGGVGEGGADLGIIFYERRKKGGVSCFCIFWYSWPEMTVLSQVGSFLVPLLM